MKKYFPGLFLILLVISCGHVPVTHYFTIDYPLVSAQNATSHGVLWVKKFDSDPLYSQDRFVYRTSNYEVKFDNYRRWVTSPAELLTLQAVKHMRASGTFARVTLVPPRLEKYLILSGRIKKFEEVSVESEHSAQVAVWAEIATAPEHRTVWAGLVQQKVAIEGSSENAILQAMSEAVQKVLNELEQKAQME